MELIFDDERGDGRQLGDLVALWLGIGAFDGSRTVLALIRFAGDDVLDGFNVHQEPMVALVTGLGPTLSGFTLAFFAIAFGLGLGAV